jgi:hypothetical protein
VEDEAVRDTGNVSHRILGNRDKPSPYSSNLISKKRH